MIISGKPKFCKIISFIYYFAQIVQSLCVKQLYIAV